MNKLSKVLSPQRPISVTTTAVDDNQVVSRNTPSPKATVEGTAVHVTRHASPLDLLSSDKWRATGSNAGRRKSIDPVPYRPGSPHISQDASHQSVASFTPPAYQAQYDREALEMLSQELAVARSTAASHEEALHNERKQNSLLRERIEVLAAERDAAQCKVEALSELVAASADLATEAEERYRQEAALVLQVQSEGDAKVRDLSLARHTVSLLEADVASLKKANQGQQQRLVEVNHSNEVLGEQLVQLKKQTEELNFVEKEIRSELTTSRKKFKAALDLQKAQSDANLAEVQATTDRLQNEIRNFRHSSSAAEKDVVHVQQAFRRKEEDLRNDLHAMGISNTNLKRDLSALEEKFGDHANRTSRKESSMELEAATILDRAETLQMRLLRAGEEQNLLLGEVAKMKEVNHILAVRLKAAVAEKEATDMEAEARKLLTRQNEEMEKQIAELRKTIHTLMRSRSSPLRSSHFDVTPNSRHH